MFKPNQIVVVLIALVFAPVVISLALLSIPPVKKEILIAQAEFLHGALEGIIGTRDVTVAEAVALNELSIWQNLKKEYPGESRYRDKEILACIDVARACAPDDKRIDTVKEYLKIAKDLLEKERVTRPENKLLLLQRAQLYNTAAECFQQTNLANPGPLDAEVEDSYLRSIADTDTLIEEKSLLEDALHQRIISCHGLANFLYGEDRPKALHFYNEVIKSVNQAKRAMDDRRTLHAYVWSQANLGCLQLEDFEFERAKVNLEKSFKLWQSFEKNENFFQANNCKLNILIGLADARRELGEDEQSWNDYREATEVGEELLEQYPNFDSTEFQLGEAYRGLSLLAQRNSDPAALELAETSVSYGRRNQYTWREGNYHKLGLPKSLYLVAKILLFKGDHEGALKRLDESIQILDKCEREKIADSELYLVQAYALRGMCKMERLPTSTEASSDLNNAVSLWKNLELAKSSYDYTMPKVAGMYGHLAESLMNQKLYEKANSALKEGWSMLNESRFLTRQELNQLISLDVTGYKLGVLANQPKLVNFAVDDVCMRVTTWDKFDYLNEADSNEEALNQSALYLKEILDFKNQTGTLNAKQRSQIQTSKDFLVKKLAKINANTSTTTSSGSRK